MYRLSYIFSVNVRVQYVHMELRHEGAQHLISVSQPEFRNQTRRTTSHRHASVRGTDGGRQHAETYAVRRQYASAVTERSTWRSAVAFSFPLALSRLWRSARSSPSACPWPWEGCDGLVHLQALPAPAQRGSVGLATGAQPRDQVAWTAAQASGCHPTTVARWSA